MKTERERKRKRRRRQIAHAIFYNKYFCVTYVTFSLYLESAVSDCLDEATRTIENNRERARFIAKETSAALDVQQLSYLCRYSGSGRSNQGRPTMHSPRALSTALLRTLSRVVAAYSLSSHFLPCDKIHFNCKRFPTKLPRRH